MKGMRERGIQAPVYFQHSLFPDGELVSLAGPSGSLPCPVQSHREPPSLPPQPSDDSELE